MKEFSPVMALVDFLPVAFFTAAGVLLMRDLYNESRAVDGSWSCLPAAILSVCAESMQRRTREGEDSESLPPPWTLPSFKLVKEWAP